MKYLFKANIFKFVVLVFVSTLFIACSRNDESVWDDVQLSTNSSSLALMFSSSKIPPAGDYGLPVIDSMKNNIVPGVSGLHLFYLSLYPQVTDPLYSPKAEELKFLYDSNGDNSLTNYPAFVANTKNYNYELDSFKMALSNQAATKPRISVGNLIKLNGSTLEMYVKVRYNDFYFDPHSVAVYIYEKNKIAPQETLSKGTVSNFVHKNVLLDFVNGIRGEVFSGTIQYGHEEELQYRYNISDQDIENIGVLTVVYSLDATGQMDGVLAVYSN